MLVTDTSKTSPKNYFAKDEPANAHPPVDATKRRCKRCERTYWAVSGAICPKCLDIDLQIELKRKHREKKLNPYERDPDNPGYKVYSIRYKVKTKNGWVIYEYIGMTGQISLARRIAGGYAFHERFPALEQLEGEVKTLYQFPHDREGFLKARIVEFACIVLSAVAPSDVTYNLNEQYAQRINGWRGVANAFNLLRDSLRLQR